MNTQGNTYTFIYSIVLVVVVAAILAFVSLSLKPYQDENIRNEKRQNILSSARIESTAENSEKLFNETIKKQYILNYKMRIVESRLLHSDMRINEIVEELGFTDESHLNRLFRKYRGVSPTEFKKRNQQI